MFMVHPHNAKSCRLFYALLLMGLLAPGALAQAQAKPEAKADPDKPADIKSLLKERHMVLSKAVTLLTDLYQFSRVGYADVLQAQRDLVRATLDLEEEPEKRIELLQQSEKIAKATLAIAEAMFRTARTNELPVFRAKALVLEIQIEIRREQAKIKRRK